jgi:hypothetical protein
VVLYTAALAAIAVTIWRSSEQAWSTNGPVAAAGDEPAVRENVV